MAVKGAGIYVTLALNMSQMATGFNKASSTIETFVKQTNKTLGGLGKFAIGVGVAEAARRAVMYVADMTVEVTKARDEMGDMARMIGVTTEDMSALSHMAGALGMDVNTVATNMARLSKNVIEASEDSGKAKEAFRALGMSVKDAAGNIRQPMELLTELNQKFSEMQDGTVKTALAMKLFGKSGAQMLEILNMDRGAFLDMYDTLKRLGLLMSDETAARAEHLRITFYKASLQVQAMKGEIVTGLMPALQQIGNSMVQLSEYHKTWQALGEAIGWCAKWAVKIGLAFGAGLSMATGLVDGFIILIKSRWNEMLEELQRMTGRDMTGIMFESWRPGFGFEDVLHEATRGLDKWYNSYLELDEKVTFPVAKQSIKELAGGIGIAQKKMEEWQKVALKLRTEIEQISPTTIIDPETGEVFGHYASELDRDLAKINEEVTNLRREWSSMPGAKKLIEQYEAAKKLNAELENQLKWSKAVGDVITKGEKDAEAQARTRQQIIEDNVQGIIQELDLKKRLYNVSNVDYFKGQIENYEELLTYQKAYLQKLAESEDEYSAVYIEYQKKIVETKNKLIELRAEQEKSSAGIGGMTFAMKELGRQYEDVGAQMYDFTKRAFQSMEDTFADFCVTGKMDFKSFTDSIIRDLASMTFKWLAYELILKRVQNAMTIASAKSQGGGGGLLDMLISGLKLAGSFFGNMPGPGTSELVGPSLNVAHGGIFSQGRLIRNARGNVYSMPHVFPMANGNVGLLGEAGPEAVIPLTRTSKGELGIKSEGRESSPQYQITINAVDSQSFMDICRRNPGAITDVVQSALEKNQRLRGTIRQTTR